MTTKKSNTSQMDFDVTIQTQFEKAAEVPFPTEDVVKNSALLDWDAIEESAGANREWFWNSMLAPVAFFANSLKVEVHPGWVGKVSRMGSLVRNPGDNKDPPVDVVASACRDMQNKHKQLYLLDEFTMPFLYQAMKGNDNRMLGMYTELDSLIQKCSQQSPGQVVDAKTRMIRIYDGRHWGYGIKGDGSFTFDQMEELPRTLFPIFGATQPEVWFGHSWQEPLSGFWQRWALICTPPKVFEWPTDRSAITDSRTVQSSFRDVFLNVDAAAKEMQKASGECKFKFRDDTFTAFGELRDRMQAIKDENKKDPVVLSSVSKVMREVVSTSGLIHAADQAADNCATWDPEVPVDSYTRALAEVQYHTTVALRCRPPQAVSLTNVNVCVDDTVDTLRLRRMILNMRGQDNISGTFLRKCNVLGDKTPQQWRETDGRVLEEMGLITVNARSHGFSVSKMPVPSHREDEAGWGRFKELLREKLRLSLDEYMDSLVIPEPRRHRVVAEDVGLPGAAALVQGSPNTSRPGERRVKLEVKEEQGEEEGDVVCVEDEPAAPVVADASRGSAG